jgi:hypothetical protein
VPPWFSSAAVLARELSAITRPSLANQELQWAITHASPPLRKIVRQMPPRILGRTKLIFYQLDTAFRS